MLTLAQWNDAWPRVKAWLDRNLAQDEDLDADDIAAINKMITKLNENVGKLLADVINEANPVTVRDRCKTVYKEFIDLNAVLQDDCELEFPPFAEDLFGKLRETLFFGTQCKGVDTLSTEARKVLRHYSTFMLPAYRDKMREIFVSQEGAVNCCWHEDNATFEQEYRELTAGNTSAYDASGVQAWTMPVGDYNKSFPSRDPTNVAPGNRVIALRPGFEAGTACHELFHWSTCQAYEDEAKTCDGDKNIYRVLIEGVTEYFTRAIWPGRTNYNTECKLIGLAIERKICTRDDLARAYFGNTNVKQVMKSLETFLGPASGPLEAPGIRAFYKDDKLYWF